MQSNITIANGLMGSQNKRLPRHRIFDSELTKDQSNTFKNQEIPTAKIQADTSKNPKIVDTTPIIMSPNKYINQDVYRQTYMNYYNPNQILKSPGTDHKKCKVITKYDASPIYSKESFCRRELSNNQNHIRSNSGNTVSTYKSTPNNNVFTCVPQKSDFQYTNCVSKIKPDTKKLQNVLLAGHTKQTGEQRYSSPKPFEVVSKIDRSEFLRRNTSCFSIEPTNYTYDNKKINTVSRRSKSVSEHMKNISLLTNSLHGVQVNSQLRVCDNRRELKNTLTNGSNNTKYWVPSLVFENVRYLLLENETVAEALKRIKSQNLNKQNETISSEFKSPSRNSPSHLKNS